MCRWNRDESHYGIELLCSRTADVSDDGIGHVAGATLNVKEERIDQNVSETAAEEDFVERRLTKEYSMNYGKHSFLMPKRSYASNDRHMKANPIWYAHQLNRLRRFSESSSPCCASNCAPSVMESLHDFRGSISAYQNPKGLLRNFSYTCKSDDMFRSPVGTVQPQSLRMGQRTPEHLDRFVYPKGKSQDQATSVSKEISLNSATMAASEGGSSYVPALQLTLSDYATLFMGNHGREQYASSLSTRKFENVGSNVHPQNLKVASDMKLSDDLKTISFGGREMGTHECEDQEKIFSYPSTRKSGDMGCTDHLTAYMAPSELNSILLGGQEKGPDAQIYYDTHMTEFPEEDSSCPSTCKSMDMNFQVAPDMQMSDDLKTSGFGGREMGIRECEDQEKNFSYPSTRKSGDMDCTDHLTADMAPSELSSILLGGQEKGPDTQIYYDTHMTECSEEDSSCPSTCKSMDMNPTPQTTIDENSQGQGLSFSRLQPASTYTLLMNNNTKGSEKRINDEHKICNLYGRELDTQVSGIPDKDFPSRGKSGDVDLTLETPNSVKNSLQHFDWSGSRNNVLQLSFEMWKAPRKPAIKDFEQSLSPKKIPEELDFTFSTPNAPRKHATELSLEKDAPSRCNSKDNVLELSFEVWKAPRKPATKVRRLTQKDFEQSLSPKKIPTKSFQVTSDNGVNSRL